jgi:uncharacterized protein (DUF1697 family)
MGCAVGSSRGRNSGTVTSFIALLRGVNVGGHNTIAMAELRSIAGHMGLEEPQTLLQSGNLVFRSKPQPSAKLEQLLERELKKQLSLDVSFMVRTAAEWDALIARNPYTEAARRDPGRLVVMCFKEPPDPKAVKILQGAITGRETFIAAGKQAYIVYPDGQGRSKFTLALIESKLGTRGTARNWNTVLKLAALS